MAPAPGDQEESDQDDNRIELKASVPCEEYVQAFDSLLIHFTSSTVMCSVNKVISPKDLRSHTQGNKLNWFYTVSFLGYWHSVVRNQWILSHCLATIQTWSSGYVKCSGGKLSRTLVPVCVA